MHVGERRRTKDDGVPFTVAGTKLVDGEKYYNLNFDSGESLLATEDELSKGSVVLAKMERSECF